MTSDTFTRYNVQSVHKICQQIERWIDQAENILDKESNKDYPNQEWIEMIESRLEYLNNALEALENLE